MQLQGSSDGATISTLKFVGMVTGPASEMGSRSNIARCSKAQEREMTRARMANTVLNRLKSANRGEACVSLNMSQAVNRQRWKATEKCVRLILFRTSESDSSKNPIQSTSILGSSALGHKLPETSWESLTSIVQQFTDRVSAVGMQLSTPARHSSRCNRSSSSLTKREKPDPWSPSPGFADSANRTYDAHFRTRSSQNASMRLFRSDRGSSPSTVYQNVLG